jgi:hypothetical protein
VPASVDFEGILTSPTLQDGYIAALSNVRCSSSGLPIIDTT